MTLRIVPLLLGASVLLLLLLSGESASATANNHQLSSSLSSTASSPQAADGDEGGDGGGGARLRVEAAQLVDNKIHDKLQHPVREDGSLLGAPAEPVRRKRQDRGVNAVTGARWQEVDEAMLPRITEDVLLVSNLTEERLREENELLEHLNRDRFLERKKSVDAESKKGQRNGKKGRRRKGHGKHKKHTKIKLLPVTLVGVPVDADGQPEAGLIEGLANGEDPWTQLQLPGTGTRVAGQLFDGPEDQPTGSERSGRQPGPRPGSARKVPRVVEMVDVWKETTIPPPRSEVRSTIAAFPPPPPSFERQLDSEQRKRENRQRKQLKKAGESRARKLGAPPPPPPLPSLGDAVTVAGAANTVTFPAEDHAGTETVSVARVIISGDLSCMRDDFVPAPAIANADIKYLRNDLYGLEHSFLEAEYHCRVGYRLRTKPESSSAAAVVVTSTGALANGNLVCRKSRWIGKRPACVRIKSSPETRTSPSGPGGKACGKDHGCPQACHRDTVSGHSNRSTVCSCYKGFKMVNHRCVDINECIEYGEDVCEYGCSNTIGSFTCKCPRGLRVTDNNKCMDVNECLLRNGHGPCQDTCINTWSSYRCTCDGLPGTRLAADGHACEDIDECTVGNGGCSHTCLNTLGRAFCTCPDGYMLDDDWKTCIDVDECANQKSIASDRRCHGRCINTVGSYRCQEEVLGDADGESFVAGDGTARSVSAGSSGELQKEQLPDYDTLCPTGYHFNTTMGDCQDTDECGSANGGCQQHCINSDGSYYCSCKYGFKLNIDKRSCLVLNDSLKLADVACAPLFPPRHGYLECSRPIDEIADGPSRGSLKITNRPGSQCLLKCPTGYRLEGKFSKICGTTGEWIGDENGTCIRYPHPKLTCPTSVNVELHPNDTETTTVRLRRPETDVSWDRDVLVEPSWAKNDPFLLPLGPLNVTYSARHPVSKLRTDCTFTINVLPGSPPRVDFCPDTQLYTIEGRHQSVKATWEEPVFSDNVGVVTITKSNSPGTDFGAGSHLITYEAHDDAEWKSRCVFKIVVNVSPQQQNGGQSSHLQLPILYNRFYF